MEPQINPIYMRDVKNEDLKIRRVDIILYLCANTIVKHGIPFLDKTFSQEHSDAIFLAVDKLITQEERLLGYDAQSSIHYFGEFFNLGQPINRIREIIFTPKLPNAERSAGYGCVSITKENDVRKGVLVPKKMKIEYGFYGSESLEHLIGIYDALKRFDPESVLV